MARWGRTDFRQLKNLKRNIDNLIEKGLDGASEKAVKEIAARLLAKVVKRTPVGVYPSGTGKTGGTLRRGWTIGNVVKKGDVYEVEVINPTEYAAYVEYGHRTRNHEKWVPGRFMMTISAKEIEAKAPAIVEKVVFTHLREGFSNV